MKIWLNQFRLELLKLFARRRTYMGFGGFLAVEMIILLLLQTPAAHKMFTRTLMYGINFDHYNSGLTLAYQMITNTTFLLGSLYLALVCGDVVAKEVEDGTLRMVLSRPVSRLRILTLKYAACLFYTLVLTFFIVSSSLLLGIGFKGVGGLLVNSPFEHVFGVFEPAPGFGRFALGVVVLTLVMMTLSSLGFMFSCFNMKPASATILTLSVYIIDTVIRVIPFFENFRPYSITHNMGIWTQVFQQQIPWSKIIDSTYYLGLFDLAFLVVAAYHFFHRDFKS